MEAVERLVKVREDVQEMLDFLDEYFPENGKAESRAVQKYYTEPSHEGERG